MGDKIRAYGHMSFGRLEGYNVITSLVEPFKTIYGIFRSDKLYGNAIMVNGDEAMVGVFSNGELQKIIDKNNIRDKQVY